MRKAKHLLAAALIAASTLAGAAAPLSATPASVATAAAFQLPDGTYYVRDSGGNLIGYIVVRDGYQRFYSIPNTTTQHA